MQKDVKSKKELNILDVYNSDFYDLTLLHKHPDKNKFTTEESKLIKEYFKQFLGDSVSKIRGIKNQPSWEKILTLYSDTFSLLKFDKIYKINKNKDYPIISFTDFVENNGSSDYLSAVRENKDNLKQLKTSINCKTFWLDFLDSNLKNIVDELRHKFPNKDYKAFYNIDRIIKKTLKSLYDDYELGSKVDKSKNNPFNLPIVLSLQYLISLNYKYLMTMFVSLTRDVVGVVKFLKEDEEVCDVKWVPLENEEENIDFNDNKKFNIKYTTNELSVFFKNITKENGKLISSNQKELLDYIYTLGDLNFFTFKNNRWLTREASPLMKNTDLVDDFNKKIEPLINSFFGKLITPITGVLDLKSTIYKKGEYFKTVLPEMSILTNKNFLFKEIDNESEVALISDIEDSKIIVNYFKEMKEEKRNDLKEIYSDDFIDEVKNELLTRKPFPLDKLQVDAVISSLRQPTFCAGSAGTGKSTIIMEAIKNAASKNLNVNVISPTGKATNVLKEKWDEETSNNPELEKKKVEISTFHKYLYGRTNTDKETIVIIDEVSMIPPSNMSLLLKKLTGNDKIVNFIMFGDVKQLPPIERGEFIYSYYKLFKETGKKNINGLNIVELQKVFRQNEKTPGAKTNKLMPLITHFQKPQKLSESKDVNTVGSFQEYKNIIANNTITENNKKLDFGKSAIVLLDNNHKDLTDNIEPILKKEVPTLSKYNELISSQYTKTKKEFKEDLRKVLGEWSFITATNGDVKKINDIIYKKVLKLPKVNEVSEELVDIKIENSTKKYQKVNKLDFNLTPDEPNPRNAVVETLTLGTKLVFKGNNIYDDSYHTGFTKLNVDEKGTYFDIQKEEKKKGTSKLKLAKNETLIVTDIFKDPNSNKGVIILKSPTNERVLFSNFAKNHTITNQNKTNAEGLTKIVKFNLGYCQTIHSSQGSEYNKGYTFITPSSFLGTFTGNDETFYNLNMLYTATSRAKNQTILFLNGFKRNMEDTLNQITINDCITRKSPIYQLLEQEIKEIIIKKKIKANQREGFVRS